MSSYPERLRDCFGNVPKMLRSEPVRLDDGVCPGWFPADENSDQSPCDGCHYMKCSCPPAPIKATPPVDPVDVMPVTAGTFSERALAYKNGFTWDDGWWNLPGSWPRAGAHMRRGRGGQWDASVEGQHGVQCGDVRSAIAWCLDGEAVKLLPGMEDRRSGMPPGSGEAPDWVVARDHGFTWIDGWWNRAEVHIRRQSPGIWQMNVGIAYATAHTTIGAAIQASRPPGCYPENVHGTFGYGK